MKKYRYVYMQNGSSLNSESQVKFIFIAIFKIHIVSKQLYRKSLLNPTGSKPNMTVAKKEAAQDFCSSIFRERINE